MCALIPRHESRKGDCELECLRCVRICYACWLKAYSTTFSDQLRERVERNLGGKSDLRLPFEPAVLVTPWGGALCCDATLVFPRREGPSRKGAQRRKMGLRWPRHPAATRGRKATYPTVASDSAYQRRAAQEGAGAANEITPLNQNGRTRKGMTNKACTAIKFWAQHINPLKPQAPESRV